jgi:hypothetical protein
MFSAHGKTLPKSVTRKKGRQLMRNVIILLAFAVPTAVQAAECSPGTETRRCYLGVPAVDTITKEAEATRLGIGEPAITTPRSVKDLVARVASLGSSELYTPAQSKNHSGM